tara:strand:- start:587 stop:823 length:237 start_codon:yes stop_codon:yes gene_type:complete
MKALVKELNEAKETGISSVIDNVCRKMDKMEVFFTLAETLGLVVDGWYISGIPKGVSQDVDKFYKMEDELDYPKPQMI